MVKIIELLLANGADRNLLDKNGDSASTLAAERYKLIGRKEFGYAAYLLKSNS